MPKLRSYLIDYHYNNDYLHIFNKKYLKLLVLAYVLSYI